MEILQNPQVQQAITTLLVLAITALANFVRRKTAASAIVNEWWCYLQPAADWAIDTTIKRLQDTEPATKTAVYKSVVAEALLRFWEDYSRHERQEPSDRVMMAAEHELQKAVAEKAL